MSFETLLFYSIPTIDFLGLENKKPITKTGKNILEIVEANGCEFLIPSLIPNEFNRPILKIKKNHEILHQKQIVITPLPLAIKTIPDFQENYLIKGEGLRITYAIAFLSVAAGYLTFNDKSKGIQIYDSNTKDYLGRYEYNDRILN